jgi:hypothetical protein
VLQVGRDKPCKPTRKPGLTKDNKLARLKWCLDHKDLSRSGIAVFDALVSCKLRGRRPLYIGMGRGVTDPLTALDFL